tara:strand:- start:30 stop:509 length:480 start_codon:yes stop_codon:yes gene_type:complete
MSTLVTNTITGLSTAANITIGSTPVVSASANSLTVRGEGSAQTSVQQGLAKCWINFNGTGTIAARDSFNVTSITDDATGNYRVTIANDMASVGYSISGTSMHEEDGTADARSTLLTNRSGAIRTATIFAVHSVLGSSQDVADAFFDANNISTQVSGDLA